MSACLVAVRRYSKKLVNGFVDRALIEVVLHLARKGGVFWKDPRPWYARPRF